MKVLVAYVSGYGATAEVAKEIAQVLARDHQVEVKSAAAVKSLAPYEAVVLGSSMRTGRWLGGLPRFLGRFHRELTEKSLALFAVCLTARTLEGSRRVLSESLPRLLARHPQISPVATAAFGGVLDFERYNLALRMLMRRMAAEDGLPTSGLVDLRNWQAIREWAAALAAQLSDAGTKAVAPDPPVG